MSDGAVTVRSRRAVIVGGLWLLTGTVLLVSGIMLFADQRRVWLELPLSLPALVIGGATVRSSVVFGPAGIDVIQGIRPRRRVLWAAVDQVVIDHRTRVAVPVWLRLRDDRTIELPATWGMSRRRREHLQEALGDLAAPQGTEIVRASALSELSSTSQPDLTS